MKKRSIVTSAASVLLAGVMCVGFAACGDEDVDVGKKIDALTGEKVTEEVWNSALNIDSAVYNNFALDVVWTDIYEEEGTKIEAQHWAYAERECYGWVSLDYTAMSEDEKSRIEGIMEADLVEGEIGYSVKLGAYKWKTEVYFDGVDGLSYENCFGNNKGKWKRYDLWDSDVPAFGYLGGMTGIVSVAHYAEYTYSEEKKGYVYAFTDERGDETEVVAKFAEGKLVSVEYHVTANEYGIIGQQIYYITYGGQSVKRPNVG